MARHRVLEVWQAGFPFLRDRRAEAFARAGIHPSAWEEAVGLLGEDAAVLCVLITDAKVADPEVTILSAGGYLRGMVRAHRTGSLNIMGSLIGLNERSRRRK
ncbi:replication initiation protein RepC [Rhodovulum sulfidophilum]|uniref:replication initiation protein RepC n=1 Tax=Rhodovulum sulfidophilum TaxID=35806 RepID=UPI00398C24EC